MNIKDIIKADRLRNSRGNFLASYIYYVQHIIVIIN